MHCAFEETTTLLNWNGRDKKTELGEEAGT